MTWTHKILSEAHQLRNTNLNNEVLLIKYFILFKSTITHETKAYVVTTAKNKCNFERKKRLESIL